MDRRRRLAGVMGIGFAAALVACGDDDVTTAPSLIDVPETVAMGVLPQPPSGAATLPPPPAPPTTAPATTTSTAPAPEAPIEAPVGALVSGNRILLVGDSILAAAAPRNGGQLCDALGLFGWQVEIDALSDRSIDFASEVLDSRLPAETDEPGEWDIVGLSFGSDVDGSDAEAVEQFGTALDDLVARIAPRPTLLYTLAEQDDDDGAAAVNEVIRAVPQRYPNVLVIEFADAGDDGVPVVDAAGTTLTDDGMKRFSIRTAAAVGDAPGEEDSACLPSEYQD